MKSGSFILLYADDTGLLSESKYDPQCTLDVFGSYCSDWKSNGNTEKTKVLIFPSGRPRRTNKYYFNDEQLLETINEHKYLSIMFSRS